MKQQKVFIFKSSMDDLLISGLTDIVQEEVIDNGWHIDQLSTAIDSSENRDSWCYVLTVLASKEQGVR